MKSVPWSIVKPETVKGTIWEKLDDTKLNLDFKELEEMFAAKPPATAATTNAPKVEKPAKISLLGPERNKNMELVLGKLRMSNAMLVDSLWRLNEEVLKPSVVESLCNAMPQESERGLWSADIDRSTLAGPDLFCIEISAVNGYDFR